MEVTAEKARGGPSNKVTVVVITVTLTIVIIVILAIFTWSCIYRKWVFSINKFEKLSTQMKGESTPESYEVRMNCIHPCRRR